MKAIKTLMAVSVLVAAGAANASVVGTYSFSDNGTFTSAVLGAAFNGTVVTEAAGSSAYAQSNPNTASLDVTGGTGTLTMLANLLNTTNFGGQQSYAYTITLNGAWDGTTFTATSGSAQATGCATHPSSTTCSPSTLITYNSFSGSGLTLSGGGINANA